MLPGYTRALFSDQQNESPHPVLGPSIPHTTVSAPPFHTVRTVHVHGVLVARIFWPPDVKGRVTGKEPDAGED